MVTVAELKYRGPVATEASDVGTKGTVTAAMSGDMSTGDIDARIGTGLAPYATKAYADDRDGLNATPAYVDAGDATRLKLASKDVPNGIAALDATGRVDPNRIGVPNTQRLPRGLWTPQDYGEPVTVSGNGESTLFTIDVTDPGHIYRVIVLGSLIGLSSTEGTAPRILVRSGSPTGQIIASGVGTTESYDYLGIDLFDTSRPNLGDGWEETWSGSGGSMVVNNGQARYTKSGTSSTRRGFFRRTGNDTTTLTNYQEITYRVGTPPDGTTAFGAPSQNYVYGRLSADRQSYVALEITNPKNFDSDSQNVRLMYATSGSNIGTGTGAPTFVQNTGDLVTLRCGTTSREREIQILRNGSPLLSWQDASNQAGMGPTNRGWGWGVRAGSTEAAGFPTGQVAPAFLDWITVKDAAPGTDHASYCPIPIIPASLATQTTLFGPTTLYVRLATSTGTGTVSAGHDRHPSLSVLALPA